MTASAPLLERLPAVRLAVPAASLEWKSDSTLFSLAALPVAW